MERTTSEEMVHYTNALRHLCKYAQRPKEKYGQRTKKRKILYEQNEYISKRIKEPKILELKNTITELKNLLEGFKSRLE